MTLFRLVLLFHLDNHIRIRYFFFHISPYGGDDDDGFYTKFFFIDLFFRFPAHGDEIPSFSALFTLYSRCFFFLLTRTSALLVGPKISSPCISM